MNQLSLFAEKTYQIPDEYARTENWSGRITTMKGKRIIQLKSVDGHIKNYRWDNPTTGQLKTLLREAEKLGDFPDMVLLDGHPNTTYSGKRPPLGIDRDETNYSRVVIDRPKTREQRGWIQKSYRLRLDGRQLTLRHWQPGANGPYYCYRYKAGNKTAGVYFRRDRYPEILAAIESGKSVVEILKILY